MKPEILITGGKGKTGQQISALLRQQGIAYRTGTRSPETCSDVAFDWMQPAVAERAFYGIKSLYIVAPTNSSDHHNIVVPLLEKALALGVTRFVLLSASSLEMDGPMMGALHGWLARNAPEWVVLRPTWFMQNFYQPQYIRSITEQQTLFSATGNGKVGFIDTLDIARSAVAALTTDTPLNEDVILTGPDMLSYPDIATLLGQHLSLPLTHTSLSVDALTQHHQQNGLDPAYAAILAGMDAEIAQGSEARLTDGVLRLTGKPPGRFIDFIQRERQHWPV